ncbi:polyphosphate polymerase domain-containing protein [Aeoliella mucimassa]|uniref:VTC domain protein n=1 Tax=Aeoliella mucimassa TaxID=2527972 RepID=A0A518AJ48_9BACT|nr:polyphosphate polymerase domain-containing protein [Aeoliella mucimassa]QDU54751.1 VTC domain protein [Aeoliella mucimassa]
MIDELEPTSQLDNIDQALAKFTPTSLSEIDSVSLMNRIDTKYVSNEVLLAQLLEMVRADYKVLEVDGFRRSPYETLYFDTLHRDCYLDHHNGRATRLKFRQRRYMSSGTAFFEVKQKTNRGRTIKRRVPIASIEQTLDDASKDLVLQTRSSGKTLLPQIWTLFSRITLVGLNIAERVTIDTELSFSDEQQDRALEGVTIIEVKQERNLRNSPIRQCLRQLRVPPMRISKYCIGSALLNPTLKRNRFKRKLRVVGSHTS